MLVRAAHGALVKLAVSKTQIQKPCRQPRSFNHHLIYSPQPAHPTTDTNYPTAVMKSGRRMRSENTFSLAKKKDLEGGFHVLIFFLTLFQTNVCKLKNEIGLSGLSSLL